MKALLIEKPGKMVITDRSQPVADEGEVLISIRYVGFCGSDLGSYLGRNPLVHYPRIPGHEISGEIMALGNGVPGGFRAGDKVTVVPYTSCGQCPSCRKGRNNACQHNETLGVQRDGAMQELLAVPWEKVIQASGLNERQLAIVEPLTVGFHAVARGGVVGADCVLVLGCGMIGAGVIVSAVSTGATVIAVDLDNRKLELAGLLGASHTINSAEADLHGRLASITSGRGPDVVVEAAGNPGTYRAAVEEVAFAGRVICIGYTGSEVSMDTRLIVQKEMDIIGSRNAGPEDFSAVISYLEQGTFPLDHMITDICKPEDAPDAMKSWAADPAVVMKLLVAFQ